MKIACTACGDPYPETGLPYICPKCGGIYDLVEFPRLLKSENDPHQPGLWKYWRSFGLIKPPADLYLGEGETALVDDHLDGKHILFKLEYQNPTGSYKDRATSVLAAHLLERGIKEAVEDSSGNAGASFAAYAARTGIEATVFAPDSASGPKKEQIIRYGAKFIGVPGPRSEAAAAVLNAAKSGIAYASHAYLPFGMLGIATISYELYMQTGGRIGTIIVPAGHGSLLLGIIRGFIAMQESGWMDHLPYFLGVQAKNCASLVDMYMNSNEPNRIKRTVAEGVSVSSPVRGEPIISLLKEIDGKIVAVQEDAILSSRSQLAGRGIYVEPTSAIVWPPLKEFLGEFPEPIVLVMTGSGYKYSNQ